METTLLTNVYNDILRFITEEEQNLFFNERDLQMHLALYLLKSSNNYDDVEVEYYVPVFNNRKDKILKEYDWNSEIRLDIIVMKNNEFLPVEIKYKTRNIQNSYGLSRFNKEIPDVDILKNQSAQNLGCYDFWKDVRRIEVIKNEYGKSVIGGIAIFLTNDSAYWNENIKKGSAYYNFRLSANNTDTNKKWTKNVAETVIKKYPDFTLEQAYNSEWIDKKGFKDYNDEFFRCYMVKVQ